MNCLESSPKTGPKAMYDSFRTIVRLYSKSLSGRVCIARWRAFNSKYVRNIRSISLRNINYSTTTFNSSSILTDVVCNGMQFSSWLKIASLSGISPNNPLGLSYYPWSNLCELQSSPLKVDIEHILCRLPTDKCSVL